MAKKQRSTFNPRARANMKPISLRKLSKAWAMPFDHHLWNEIEVPITRDLVEWAMQNPGDGVRPEDLAKEYEFKMVNLDQPDYWRLVHAHKVAWIIQHYSGDNFKSKPIMIDFGAPFYSDLQVWDGNHRLAAAQYLGLKYIWVDECGALTEIRRFAFTGRVKSEQTGDDRDRQNHRVQG